MSGRDGLAIFRFGRQNDRLFRSGFSIHEHYQAKDTHLKLERLRETVLLMDLPCAAQNSLRKCWVK